ncbi:MAG: PH domain-containing protein [Nitrososphaeraceae archaeon]
MLFGSRTKRVINFDAEPKVTTVTIQDEEELYRITEISGILDMNEKVLLVITQSKVRLVGLPFNSYVIYATDKRIIIRDISLHGLKEDTIGIPYSMITDINHKEGFISSCIRLKVNRIQGDLELSALDQYGTTENELEWIIEYIPKSKATLLDKIVRAMISKLEFLSNEHQSGTGANEHIVAQLSTLDSPVDELFKIARLKSEGVINEQEFARLKQNIIEHIH